MSGLFGCASSDPRICRRIAAPMTATTAGYPAYESFGVGESCFLGESGRYSPALAKLADKKPDRRLVFTGKIDNRRALADGLGLRDTTTDEELVQELFYQSGLDFARRLKGSFAAAIWDPAGKRLILAGDRFGTRPLYLRTSNGTIAFGSTIKALMAGPGFDDVIDLEAVAAFFSFGFYLGQQTPFKSVTLLPPASLLIWEAGRLTVKKYWEPVFSEVYPKRSLEDYSEELVDLLDRAVTRQIDDRPIACQLSGGLDSRTVAAFAHRRRPDMPLLTWGVKGCDDAKYARRVAGALGARHDWFEITPDFLWQNARQIVRLTDGLLNYKHAHFISFLDSWSTEYRAVLSGVGGGELLWRNPKLFDRPTADVIFDSWNYYVPDGDFRAAFSPALRRAAVGSRERFADLIGAAGCARPENVAQHFLLTQHDRRFNFQYVDLLRQWLDCRLPFYDYDLVDFSLRTPPEVKTGALMYAGAFKKEFPALAAVPWQKFRRPVGSHGWRKLGYRFKNKVVRQVDTWAAATLNQRLIEESWERRYADWMRTEPQLKRFVTEKILSFGYLEQYLNRPYVEALVQRHMAGRADHQEQLGVILTFVLWHEMFVQEKSALKLEAS